MGNIITKSRMVRAWYMDNSTEDQRLEHHQTPQKFLSLDDLAESTGVLHWKLDADSYLEDPQFEKIKRERGYSYQDLIEVSPSTLPNYEEKIKNFFAEHLHTDEEIRFVLAGSGYFDVRDLEENWIRVEVTQGDMIVLPAGIYHRFTLDTNNYIKALRLFVGEPVWTPYNRPADEMECRQEYLQKNTICNLASTPNGPGKGRGKEENTPDNVGLWSPLPLLRPHRPNYQGLLSNPIKILLSLCTPSWQLLWSMVISPHAAYPLHTPTPSRATTSPEYSPLRPFPPPSIPPTIQLISRIFLPPIHQLLFQLGSSKSPS
ncbi:unnamed protein product [Allacma fusca]|uniref:Acireductone dioxygenase n=1 Tax=Allacma fusca TaxID=39272 RepID=A0A8J2MGJ1_9HEXA|nr:unnamed protein product [Allacma fusca]